MTPASDFNGQAAPSLAQQARIGNHFEPSREWVSLVETQEGLRPALVRVLADEELAEIVRRQEQAEAEERIVEQIRAHVAAGGHPGVRAVRRWVSQTLETPMAGVRIDRLRGRALGEGSSVSDTPRALRATAGI